jgi:hypothetical protein
MAILGVDDFKAKLKGGGARPNLFRATINFPAYAQGDVEITSFMCRAAQLPGSIMSEIIVPFRGRELKIAGDRTFDVWTPTIINDTDFNVRNAMERWMNGINAHSANTGIVNPTDYQTDLVVEQLDKDESVLKTYTFRGCFPTNIDPIDLSYDPAAAIEEFSVTFQVQYWESPGTTS